MRSVASICVLALAVALGGCGESEEEKRRDEARQVVLDAIAAYEDEDYEELCSLSGIAIRETVPEVARTDSCPEAYERFFAEPARFGEPGAFDEFVRKLSQATVEDATLTERGATVTLTVPGEEGAATFLVEEDGELKIEEMLATADSAAAQGAGGAVLPE